MVSRKNIECCFALTNSVYKDAFANIIKTVVKRHTYVKEKDSLLIFLDKKVALP
jgi:hypothetical protein